MDLVLTVIGPDRPGLVETLSRLVTGHDASWEESRMARLAGRFAGVLRVRVDPGKALALTRALEALGRGDLRVTVERVDASPDSAGGRLLLLDFLGHDRPGIVHEVSAVLVEHGANVEELETTVESAAMSGERMFKARALVRVPEGLTVEVLDRELQAVADELMLDLHLDLHEE